MNRTKNKDSKNLTSDGYAYFTKRTLLTKARAAGKKAATQAMSIMGYVVVAENGWIIKKFEDGHVEQISKVR